MKRRTRRPQHPPQLSRVFNRHARPLRQVRHHRVGCIAQQCHAPLGLLLDAAHWGANAQHPQAPVVNRVNQRLQRRTGGTHGAAQVGRIAVVIPVLNIACHLTVHERDHIKPLAPAHRVLHHMQAGTQPGCDLLAAQVGGQTALGHQCPVRQMPHGLRQSVAQQLLTHTTPQAVGTHQQVSLCLAPIRQVQLHAMGQLHKPVHGAVDIQLHTGLSQCGPQQRMQIGPVDGGIRKAVACLNLRPQRQHAQLGACAGTAYLQPVREGGHGCQLVFHTPTMQHAHPIGAQLNAGAHLGKLG